MTAPRRQKKAQTAAPSTARKETVPPAAGRTDYPTPVPGLLEDRAKGPAHFYRDVGAGKGAYGPQKQYEYVDRAPSADDEPLIAADGRPVTYAHSRGMGLWSYAPEPVYRARGVTVPTPQEGGADGGSTATGAGSGPEEVPADTVKALQGLHERLGEGLGYTGTRISHKPKDALRAKLLQYQSDPTGMPSLLDLEATVAGIVTTYQEAAEQDKAAAVTKQARLATEQAATAERAAKKANDAVKTLSMNDKSTLFVFAGSEVGLQRLLTRVSEGHHAALVKLVGESRPWFTVDTFYGLLARTGVPLLRALVPRCASEQECTDFLAAAGKPEEVPLTLIDLAATIPDLTALLSQLAGDARTAETLLQRAGQGRETQVLGLLKAGIDKAEAAKLLKTSGGKDGGEADVLALRATAGLDQPTSMALLGTAGVRGGGGAAAAAVLKDKAVGGDTARAVSLLDRKGSAADARDLLAAGVALDKAVTMLSSEQWDRGQGAGIAARLKQTAVPVTVDDVVGLLASFRAKALVFLLDPALGGQTPATLTARKDRPLSVWAGATCAAPVVIGPTDTPPTLAHVMANAGPYYKGNAWPNGNYAYAGDRDYNNLENDPEDGLLPKKTATGSDITYKEYDLRYFTSSADRGKRRMVVGSDHHRYVTLDHYVTMQRFL